jgi:parallel beta-helix repeat protein
VNPITVCPGTNGVVGNGSVNGSGAVSGNDDTTAWQTILNNHDVIVCAGTYRIDGSLSIPTGRVIQCQPGATFLDSQSKNTVMFAIGGYYGGGGLGNNSISGCTFEGTDVPAGANNYANFVMPSVGYSQLFEISSGGGAHVANVNLQNNTFKDGQGDLLLVYSPCGTLTASGWQCSGATPGTEGPSNITIYNNTLSHAGQPGIHINGGQNVHVVGNTVTDTGISQEMDPNVGQVMSGIMLDHNTIITGPFGGHNGISGVNTAGGISCDSDNQFAFNGTGCWAIQNLVTGQTSPTFGSQGGQLSTGSSSDPASPGNYFGNVVTNGAFVSGQGVNQLTVPWCGGGVCTTTGWLQTPPVR